MQCTTWCVYVTLFLLPYLFLTNASINDPGISDIVPLGTVGPWAKGTGIRENTVYICKSARQYFKTVVAPTGTGAFGSTSQMWMETYTMIQETAFYDAANIYIVVQPASLHHFNITTCSTTPTPTTITNVFGTAEVYGKCGTDTSLTPTHTPTFAPTRQPTLPPSTPTPQPTPAGNPYTEAECDSITGDPANWAEVRVQPSTTSILLVRFCCGAPECTGTAYYTGYESYAACACNAVGTELTLRNNTFGNECEDFCFNSDYTAVVMNYCPPGVDVQGCSGSYLCTNPSGLQFNACTSFFSLPPSPQPSATPTTVPTALPSHTVTVPNHPCWTFDVIRPDDYGPTTVDECNALNGTNWGVIDLYGAIVARYCCGPCTGIFRYGGFVYCACPPRPTESQVRNNTVPCSFCFNETGPVPSVSATFCPGMPECTGSAACSPGDTVKPGLCSAVAGDYGPMTATECYAKGGSFWASLVLEGATVVRYCCGLSACTGAFDSFADGYPREGCACNPRPTESQVRNNAAECSFCVESADPFTDPFVSVSYCPNTTGCTGSHTTCTNVQTVSGATFDANTACDPPTQPVCGTPQNSEANWCSRSVGDMYKVANFTIQPSSWPGTVDNLVQNAVATGADIESANLTDAIIRVQALVTQSIAAATSGACWCARGTGTRDWFPYSMIRLGTIQGAELISAGSTPAPLPPRDFYPGNTHTAGYMYLQTVVTNGRPDVVAIYTNSTNILGTIVDSSDDIVLAPTEQSCTATSGCDYVDTRIDLFGTPVCRFVCASILATSFDSLVYPSTVLIDVTENVTGCTSRPNFMWIQHNALVLMTLTGAWQHAVDTLLINSTRPQWVPYLNMTTGISDASNCLVLGYGFCGLEMEYHQTFEQLYCGWNDTLGEPAAEWLRIANVVGMATEWDGMSSGGCDNTGTTTTPLELLVPTIHAIDNVPESNLSVHGRREFLRRFYSAYWENMMTRSFGYSLSLEKNACTGNTTQEIAIHGYGTVNVTFGRVWHPAGTQSSSPCTGLDGCAQVPTDTCADVPGCRLGLVTTMTTSHTTTTPGLPTFPLVQTTVRPVSHYVQVERDAQASAAAIAALIVLSIIVVGVFCRISPRRRLPPLVQTQR